DPAGHHGDLASQYVVHCPDVLAIMIDGRPDWCGDRAVGSDGRVWLDSDTALRVDGLTVAEITAAAARRCRLRPERIAVRVAEYNSQRVYLFGEVKGLQQSVAYEGPETVIELLQRVGGITPG